MFKYSIYTIFGLVQIKSFIWHKKQAVADKFIEQQNM